MNSIFAAIANLIRYQKEALLSAWRIKVRQLPAAQHLDKPTVDDHIPFLLEELATAFELENEESAAAVITKGSSSIHGLQRLGNGFEIEEVIAEYNIMRGCILDLADKHGLLLQGAVLHLLNREIDAAVGAAVKAYVTQQEREVQRRREDYLAFVAHDLRTPLSAIAVAAEILEAEMADRPVSPKAQRVLQSLRRNASYLTSLVQKVLLENINLETAAGAKIERRTLDLWPLIEDLAHDLRPAAEPGNTQLINDVPEHLQVRADAMLLRRVFQNLIANAIRHAPNGEVRVTARRVWAEKLVECEVVDNGTGIAAERLPRVFNKFETGGKRATDFGLGLTICKTLIEAHGGTITVESGPNQGSRFYFTLPDAPDEMGAVDV